MPPAPSTTQERPEPAPSRGARLQFLLAAAAFAALAARQLAFVRSHAVNVLYADQWDIYQPFFQGQGWWAMFDLQHGPHREGVGLILTRLVAAASGWDSRWDAFAASAILIGACALAFPLARRFLPRESPLLLAGLPLLFLDVHQYEMFTGAVNLSYGAVPMALLMAYGLAWFIEGPCARNLCLAGLTVLLLFTGYGLFVGLLTPLLAITESAQSWRAGKATQAKAAATNAALCAAGWLLFARGYVFEPAVPGFHFPYEHPLEYLVFVGRMAGNFFGLPALSFSGLAAGLLAAAALAWVAARSAWVCLTRGVAAEPKSAVLFSFSAFTLIFAANCAIGRVFTGPIAPLAPRYATLLIPGMLAFYLEVAGLARGRAVAFAFLLILVPATALLRADEVYGANWYADGKRAWKKAYLETRDQARADEQSQFTIYPTPLGDRLNYLQARQLNLFSGDAGPR